MKMEPTVSSETSAIRTQTPGNYPKRNKLHLEHGESLQTRTIRIIIENLKIFKIAPIGFGSQGIHHQGVYCTVQYTHAPRANMVP